MNKYWKGIAKKLKETFVSIDYQTLEKMLFKFLTIMEDPSQEITKQLLNTTIEKSAEILNIVSAPEDRTGVPATPTKLGYSEFGTTPMKFKKYPFAEPTTPAKRTNIIKDYTLTEIEAEYDSASNAEINEKLKENEDSLRWIVNLYVTKSTKSTAEKEKFRKEFKTNIVDILNTGGTVSEKSIKKYVLPIVVALRNWSINLHKPHYSAIENRTTNQVTLFSKDMIGMGLQKSEKRWEALGSLNQVKYFPKKLLSDEAVGLIYFLVDKKKFNQKMFDNLDKEEKSFISSLMRKSGLAKMLNIFPADEEASEAKELYLQLKERYEILEGEIEAGNNNPELKKELEQVKKQLKQQITFMASKLNIYGLKTAQMMILSL